MTLVIGSTTCLPVLGVFSFFQRFWSNLRNRPLLSVRQFIESPFTCDVRITDVRGKNYLAHFDGWWYPERLERPQSESSQWWEFWLQADRRTRGLPMPFWYYFRCRDRAIQREHWIVEHMTTSAELMSTTLR